jgi:hypothetical protein
MVASDGAEIVVSFLMRTTKNGSHDVGVRAISKENKLLVAKG